MIITRYKPCVALEKYIKWYYHIDNRDDLSITDSYFADGCVEAVFSTGWNFYKDGVEESWAKVIGQIIKPRTLRIVGKGKSFGIWFHPHTFSCFNHLKMSELTDRVADWELLFPKWFADFVGNCLNDHQLDKLIEGTDTFLMTQLSKHKESCIDRIAENAIRSFYDTRTHISLNQLASTLNVSQRYLQKTFLERVGMTQKQFLRMIRFQQTLLQMSKGGGWNFTKLTYDNDYYDQSHFVKEFKSFTGLSPSEFVKENFPINQHFITAE